MKTKNLLLSLLMIVAFVFGMTNTYAANDKKKEKKTVVIKAELHCKSCVAKIEKNIPFEKGVKDLKVDMKAKTVTVTYRADKNNKENIIKAIEKLGIKVLDKKGSGCSGKCGVNCCKVTGDKSKCCKKGHHHHHDKAECKGNCRNCKDKSCKKAGKKDTKCTCKCDKHSSKGHKCEGKCDKDHKCTGECKTCKDKTCKKAGTDAKCDKKHHCGGCSH